MAKVIVERPRHNSRHGHFTPGRAHALTDDDGVPLGVRVKPTRQEKTKNLNEHLGPLRRFIDKQVGRPWDKVYSEISEHLKATNPVQQHVRDHLEDFVAVRTRMENGKVISAHNYLGSVGLEREWRRYYVHPKTGLLRRNPHWRTWAGQRKAEQAAKAAERAKRMRSIASYTQLHKLDDGGWWEITLKDFGAEPARDVVLSVGLSTLAAADLYGRDGVYAAQKRALSKKEKKALGLL